MLCSTCNSPITSEYLYCPQCGVKVGEVVPSKNGKPAERGLTAHSPFLAGTAEVGDHLSITPTPPIKSPMPFWFKLVTTISVIALIAVTAGILFTESLVDVIDNQLAALREHQIEKAYFDFTSKEFQKTTSFSDFKNYIEAYPVFENNQSAHFTKRSIENNIAILKGQMTTQDHVKNPVEYKLAKENGKWKVLSIRLLKPSAIKNAKNENYASSIVDIVKGQLSEIQHHNFSTAYKQYSSHSFMDATPESAFEDFLHRYPILTSEYAASFHHPNIRNGIGSLSVTLEAASLSAYVKYYLIHEGESWKIWSMRVISSASDRS